MKHQRKSLLCILLVLVIAVACNLPGNTPKPLMEDSNTPQPAPTDISQKIDPTPTSTPTMAPADIQFHIDCTALDASEQSKCDLFVAQTRDLIYPIYRELTGTSLSKCFDGVYYTILPGETVAPEAGGQAAGNHITYVARYSVDLPYTYDAHELLHTFNYCNGALDGHVFHGALMNAAYSRLNVSQEGYFSSRANAADLNSSLFEMVKTSSGNDLYNECRGILANHITMAYFDLGEDATVSMYKSTISPNPVTPPNDILSSIWGADAVKVQMVLEKLGENKYSLDVPSCGYK